MTKEERAYRLTSSDYFSKFDTSWQTATALQDVATKGNLYAIAAYNIAADEAHDALARLWGFEGSICRPGLH